MEVIILINQDQVLLTYSGRQSQLSRYHRYMMVAHHPVALFSHSDACIKELDKFLW